jgi:hypothetical protein
MARVIRGSIVPVVNDLGVPTGNAVWLVFDDSLDTGTVNADTFKLLRNSGDASLPGGGFSFTTTKFANDTLVFTPGTAFEPDETIEVVLTNGITVGGAGITPYDARLTLGTDSLDSGADAFAAADSGWMGGDLQRLPPVGRFDEPTPDLTRLGPVSADAFGAPTATKTVAATGNNNIDGLLYGYAWGSNSVTFSFTDNISDYEASYTQRSLHETSFQALGSAQRTVAREWIGSGGEYANVSGLTPSELTGASDKDATIRMAMSDVPGTAFCLSSHRLFCRGRRRLVQPGRLQQPSHRQLCLSHLRA